MPKRELTIKEKIAEAITRVHEALIEKIDASKGEFEAKARSEKARYTLHKAEDYLNSVKRELMSDL